MITNEVLNATKRLIFLRNPIAHEYYKIKHEELKEMGCLVFGLRSVQNLFRRTSNTLGALGDIVEGLKRLTLWENTT